MKCKICGVIGKEICNDCIDFHCCIKNRCVACGYDLGYSVNRYIAQGNYCKDCCSKAGRRAFFNIGKLCAFDFKDLLNATNS